MNDNTNTINRVINLFNCAFKIKVGCLGEVCEVCDTERDIIICIHNLYCCRNPDSGWPEELQMELRNLFEQFKEQEGLGKKQLL